MPNYGHAIRYVITVMEDAIRSWRKPATQPSMTKIIREKLGVLSTAMDAELISAMNELMNWWIANKATHNAECCRPVPNLESGLSPQHNERPR